MVLVLDLVVITGSFMGGYWIFGGEGLQYLSSGTRTVKQ